MAGAGGKKSLFMIIGVAVLVCGVGIGGFMMGRGGKAKAGAQAAESAVNAEVAAEAKGEAKSEPKAEAKSEGHGEAKTEGKKEGGEGAAEASQEMTHADLTYSFDPFIVNLLDPAARTMLRCTISIEAKNTEGLAKVKDNVYPLRDITLTLLSSKTGQELMRPDGKDRVKTELRARCEGRLGPKVIGEIYIGEWLINNQ